MKYLCVVVLGMALISSVCVAAEPLDLNDSKVRDSYSVGYQVGGDFKRQETEIRPEMLLKGIQDALGNQAPAMTKEEMRQALVDLQKKVTAVQEQRNKEEAEKNRERGKAFLTGNGQKPGVKSLPSGLQYKVIKEGTGVSPKPADTVTVHYRGTLIDGTEFDSSYSRNQPASFRADRVIKGWEEALQLMKEGAKWGLFIPAELAYGERGPLADRVVLYDIELISVAPGQ